MLQICLYSFESITTTASKAPTKRGVEKSWKNSLKNHKQSQDAEDALQDLESKANLVVLSSKLEWEDERGALGWCGGIKRKENRHKSPEFKDFPSQSYNVWHGLSCATAGTKLSTLLGHWRGLAPSAWNSKDFSTEICFGRSLDAPKEHQPCREMLNVPQKYRTRLWGLIHNCPGTKQPRICTKPKLWTPNPYREMKGKSFHKK